MRKPGVSCANAANPKDMTAEDEENLELVVSIERGSLLVGIYFKESVPFVKELQTLCR